MISIFLSLYIYKQGYFPYMNYMAAFASTWTQSCASISGLAINFETAASLVRGNPSGTTQRMDLSAFEGTDPTVYKYLYVLSHHLHYVTFPIRNYSLQGARPACVYHLIPRHNSRRVMFGYHEVTTAVGAVPSHASSWSQVSCLLFAFFFACIAPKSSDDSMRETGKTWES